jgi:peptidoglycan/xylan/chitin deacetylase (PgdA/CDA1 family)
MAALHTAGWRSLSPQEFLQGHAAGGWPARSFVLTFDDGFENFGTDAAPALMTYGFTAILFVVAGHVGGMNDWVGQPAWVRRQRLLDWPALRALIPSGLALGAHAWSHRHLGALSQDEAEQEMMRSKRAIEDETGVGVEWFAYPYGETSASLERAAGRHFVAAVGTRLAFATAGNRLTALDRVDVFYLRRRWLFSSLDAKWVRPYLALRRILRAERSSEV